MASNTSKLSVRYGVSPETDEALTSVVGKCLKGIYRASEALHSTIENEPNSYSSSILLLDFGLKLLVCAEVATFGARVELFRVAAFGEDHDKYHLLVKDVNESDMPPPDISTAISRLTWTNVAVLMVEDEVDIEPLPNYHFSARVETCTDVMFLFDGQPILVIYCDDDLPAQLKMTTSPLIIRKRIEQAKRCELL